MNASPILDHESLFAYIFACNTKIFLLCFRNIGLVAKWLWILSIYLSIGGVNTTKYDTIKFYFIGKTCNHLVANQILHFFSFYFHRSP